MFRIPSLVRGRRGYEEGEEWRERWRDDVMGRKGDIRVLKVHTLPSSPSLHHSQSTQE